MFVVMLVTVTFFQPTPFYKANVIIIISTNTKVHTNYILYNKIETALVQKNATFQKQNQ